MSDILEIGISRQAVNRAEVLLASAIAAQSHRWYQDHYSMQGVAGNVGGWEVHSLRSDVPCLR